MLASKSHYKKTHIKDDGSDEDSRFGPLTGKAPVKKAPPVRRLTDAEQSAAMSLFQTLVAEGDGLMRKEFYSKSDLAFQRALVVKRKLIYPGDKRMMDRDIIYCLLQRSKCRMQMGNPKGALEDAEEALKECLIEKREVNPLDPGIENNHLLPIDYHKALYARAEALYCLGDFEAALVDYHRGHRMRPENQHFKHGVLKTTEAIQKAVGNIDAKRLRIQRDIALRKEMRRMENMTIPSDASSPQDTSKNIPTSSNTTETSHSRSTSKQAKLRKKPTKSPRQRMEMERIFLEELSEDRLFLYDLQKDPIFMSAGKGAVGHLVKEALDYLETRVEFWRRHNPTAGEDLKKKRKQQHQLQQEQKSRPASAGVHGHRTPALPTKSKPKRPESAPPISKRSERSRQTSQEQEGESVDHTSDASPQKATPSEQEQVSGAYEHTTIQEMDKSDCESEDREAVIFKERDFGSTYSNASQPSSRRTSRRNSIRASPLVAWSKPKMSDIIALIEDNQLEEEDDF